AEDHLAAVLTDEHDLDATGPDHEKRVSGVVLEENNAAFGVDLLSRDVRESLQLDAIQPAEQRNGSAEVCGLGRYGRRHEALGKSRRQAAREGFAKLPSAMPRVKPATCCRLVF